MTSSIVRISVLCACLLPSAFACADPYAPQPMQPTPLAQRMQIGRSTGMQPYPATIPGQPGAAAPDRHPWAQPQWLPYEGSVENWRLWNQNYRHPVPPFNHRTLVKMFPAQDLQGVQPEMRETYAAPVEYVVRGGPSIYPGDHEPAVPVVRLTPGGEQLRLTLDPLPTGLYTVRVIAAVAPGYLEDFGQYPGDVLLTMTINDGPQGEARDYVLRQRGTDNFYALGEFYFHVEDARPWQIALGLHADGNVPLLVHSADVHDLLAESSRQGSKQRSVLLNPETLAANWQRPEAAERRAAHEAQVAEQVAEIRRIHPELSEQEARDQWRRARDRDLWLALAPKNFNFYKVGPGGPNLASMADPQTQQALEAAERLPADNPGWFPPYRPGQSASAFWTLDYEKPWRMVWEQKDGELITYTADDLLAHKPLPGLEGVYSWGRSFDWPDGSRSLLFPIAQARTSALRQAMDRSGQYQPWVKYGIEDNARDAAITLIRLAYDLPTYSEAHTVNDQFSARGAYYNRVTIAHHFRRNPNDFIVPGDLARHYDMLFAYIQGNQDLADAVGEHIKWVKTPDDVIALLDNYLVQYAARDALYRGVHPGTLAQLAAIAANPDTAAPLMDALFGWTWVYPHPYGSIEDYMYLAAQRDGTQTIGSFFYALAPPAIAAAVPMIDEAIADGSDPKYKLSDIRRFPRIAQFPYFLMQSRVAGLHAPQIGDVGGPSTAYGQWFNADSEQMNLAWRWTGDPRFAWLVRHFGQRRQESDAQWQALLDAADTVQRNPMIDNPSRVLTDWAAILEGNVQAEDFRLRHAARIRIGVGVGHAHQDTLSLGLWSQGLTMAGNLGGRGGYGRPDVAASRNQNLVTIDGHNWMGHAWARELADLGHVQYTSVDTLRSQAYYARQLALVELDRGAAATQPPSDARHGPQSVYGRDMQWPRAYAVDFARTIGGREHSYNFNGPTEDDFQINLTARTPAEHEAAWLEGYVVESQQWAADNDQPVLQATWRASRESKRFEVPGRGTRTARAAEPAMLGPNFDPEGPRRYLRVHLPDQQGASVRSGVAVSAPYGENRPDGEWLRRVHVVRTAEQEPARSLFVAVWEPYADAPFIDDVRVEGDLNDARGFAALYVRTQQGEKDLIFSDAAQPALRHLEDGVSVHGHFAYLGRDEQGVRQMSLVAGTHFACDLFTIDTHRAIHETRVTAVDYLTSTATVDQPLPAVLRDRSFEVGRDAQDRRGPRWSNFQVTAIEQDRLHWAKGADGGTAIIQTIEPIAAMTHAPQRDHWIRQGGTDEHVVLTLHIDPGLPAGRNRQIAMTGDHPGPVQANVDVIDRHVLVRAEELSALGVGIGDRVRFYEIAVGDLFRTPAQVSLERITPQQYRLVTDVPMSLRVGRAVVSYSTDDGASWQPMSAMATPSCQLEVDHTMLGKGPILIRLE